MIWQCNLSNSSVRLKKYHITSLDCLYTNLLYIKDKVLSWYE